MSIDWTKVNYREIEEDQKYLSSFAKELEEKMLNEVDKKIKFIDEETDKIIFHAVRKIDSSVLTKEDCIEFLKVHKERVNMLVLSSNFGGTGYVLTYYHVPLASFVVNYIKGTIKEQEVYLDRSEENLRRLMYPYQPIRKI
jgi:hypothetical protein